VLEDTDPMSASKPVLEAGGRPPAWPGEQTSRVLRPLGPAHAQADRSTPPTVSEDDLSGGNAFHRRPLRHWRPRRAQEQCAFSAGGRPTDRARRRRAGRTTEGLRVKRRRARRPDRRHLPPAGLRTYFTTGERKRAGRDHRRQ